MINEEDGATPASVTGAIAVKDMPLFKYKNFTVPSKVFRKFETGRNKFESGIGS